MVAEEAPRSDAPARADRRFRVALVVYTLLGFLAVTAWQGLRWADEARRRRIASARHRRAALDLERVAAALDEYWRDRGEPPNSLGDLARARRPGGVARYIFPLPIDPWTGQVYRWEAVDGGGIVVYCLGDDDAPGGRGTAADLRVRSRRSAERRPRPEEVPKGASRPPDR